MLWRQLYPCWLYTFCSMEDQCRRVKEYDMAEEEAAAVESSDSSSHQDTYTDDLWNDTNEFVDRSSLFRWESEGLWSAETCCS